MTYQANTSDDRFTLEFGPTTQYIVFGNGPDQQAVDMASQSVMSVFDGLFDSDALAYLLASGSSASQAQVAEVNAGFQMLKLSGIWDKLDFFFHDFGISEQAALVDLKNPQNVAINNGATYLANFGFLGDGVSAYIDTTISVDDLEHYTLNSASMGCWNTNDVTSDGRDIGFTTSANAYLISRSLSGNASARINDMSGFAEITNSSSGFRGINRSSIDDREMYHNGSQIDNDVQASTGMPSGNFCVLRGNNVYSTRRISTWWAGSSLTQVEWEKMYEIVTQLKNSIITTPVEQMLDYRARSIPQTRSSSNNILNVDAKNGHAVVVLLDESITEVNVNNWPVGFTRINFLFTQDGNGNHTITWPNDWIAPSIGLYPQPISNPGYVTSIVAESFDSGNTIRMSMGDTWNA